MGPAKTGDVVTIGEVMVRLAPDPGVRLEDARSFNVQVGGAECNVAVGLAGLGRKCAWISKLADNELGRLVLRRVRACGVDVSRVVWSKGSRAGTYFVEFGKKPRPTKVIYDRRNSAASKLGSEEIDWEFVTGFRMVHLTGITPALSPSCRRVVSQAIERARDAGVKISFDVNYRSKLWTKDRAFRCLDKLVRGIDVLTVTEGDAWSVFGLKGSPDDVVRKLHDRYGSEVTVLTLGEKGAVALGKGNLHRAKGHEIEEVDRIGAGDAFDAGFLHGYLDGDIQKGLELGSAMAAVKHTMEGDFPVVTEAEILEIAGRRESSISR